MTRCPDSSIRERCSKCRSVDIYARKSGIYYCRKCRSEFTDPICEARAPKPQKSGNFAGTITIGKGTKWGAEW